MIDLNQEVEITLNSKNINYYKEKGYNIENLKIRNKNDNRLKIPRGTKILVKLMDLSLKSHTIITCNCDYCGDDIKIAYSVYNVQKEKSLIKNDSCKKCSNIYKISDSRKLNYKNNEDNEHNINNLKKEFELRDYILLTKEYIKSKSKLEYICNKHKEKNSQFITYSSFKNGSGCKYCGFNNRSNKQRMDISEIKKQFENRNYNLISEEYNNSKDKLKYICNKHPEKGIQQILYSKFNQGQGCKYCAYDKNAKRCRFSINFISEQFKNKDYELISDYYINNKQKLNYICLKHKEKGIQNITYDSIQTGCGCYYCGLEITGNAKRLDFDFVKFEFEKRNYILIEKEYVNNSTPMKYICNKHSEIVQEITYGKLKQGEGCKLCSIENRSGENHYCWKGGTSTLRNYLYGKISDWKRESMKQCNYKCIITGERFDDIHHLYGFSFILEEILSSLNMSTYKEINEYSDLELKQIEDKCLELHNKYPLGVCLTYEIHELFHKIYGYGNNTPDQFEEFKQRYYNNEFDSILNKIQTKNLNKRSSKICLTQILKRLLF